MASLRRHWGIIAATAFVALVAAFVVYEWDAARDRKSTAQIEQEFLAALPIGSSEAAVTRYLEDRDLLSGKLTVDEQPGTDLETLGLALGTRVVIGYFTQGGSIFWVAPREVNVYFILNDADELEDIAVVAWDIL